MARVKLKEVLGWRFWLNYVITLLLTGWIPMARLQFRVEETGNVVNTTTMSMYQIYAEMAQNPATPYVKYIVLHLGGVFVITALVWYLVARRDAAARAEPAA